MLVNNAVSSVILKNTESQDSTSNLELLNKYLSQLEGYLKQVEKASSPSSMSIIVLNHIKDDILKVYSMLQDIQPSWIKETHQYQRLMGDLDGTRIQTAYGSSLYQEAKDGDLDILAEELFYMKLNGKDQEFEGDINSFIYRFSI